MRILVSTTDSDLATSLRGTFRPERFTLDLATQWSEARAHLERRDYDLALLDLSSCEPTAMVALQQARRLRPSLPILVLVSDRQVESSEPLFAMGADDFALRSATSSLELLARVQALTRRGARQRPSVLRVQDLELDLNKRTVLRGGKRIHLTSKEYALLEYLARNAGCNVTREQIVGEAWSLRATPQTNVVEVYINYLRKKIDSNCDHKLIRTVRGIGYRLLRSEASDSSPGKAASA